MTELTAAPAGGDTELGDDLTPWQRVRRNLTANRLAMAGGVLLLLFLAAALIGWWGTSGEKPYFDASAVRLPDKLKPPLAAPNPMAVPPEARPRLGIYLFGTDELGRDVFARMLEGATVSLSVGFVAVGIAVVLGVAMGGAAGFYGERAPGGAPLLGALAAPLAGFALWRDFGILPLAGAAIGGLCDACRRGRGRSFPVAGIGGGFLLGLAFSPLGPAAPGLAALSGGVSLFPPGGAAELWAALASLCGLAAFGGRLGSRAEEELSAVALLGGILGFAIAHAAGIAGAVRAGGTLWSIALGAAALGAWGAANLRLDRLIRRWRLPRVDIIFTMLVDVQLSFPTFFLILTVIALLPPSIWNIMVVIGVTGWVGPARFVRAEILSLRERPFIEAAVALGGNDMRLIFLHLVPNSLAPVLVSATIGIASAILTEAGLSFLGFGVPPPHATWGNILSDGKKYLFDAPWLTYIPGTAILIVVLAFNLFGEGLRDALNPRAKPS